MMMPIRIGRVGVIMMLTNLFFSLFWLLFLGLDMDEFYLFFIIFLFIFPSFFYFIDQFIAETALNTHESIVILFLGR